MTTKPKPDNGLKLLQESVGCTQCFHADQTKIGIEDACKDCLTDIGPCSLRCRNFLLIEVGKLQAEKAKKAA